jgi:hypothetical protein
MQNLGWHGLSWERVMVVWRVVKAFVEGNERVGGRVRVGIFVLFYRGVERILWLNLKEK